MIYEYECEECNIKRDVIKPVREYNTPEKCFECGKGMRKLISISRPIVDSMQPEYYHSLGTVVKSKRHRRELMKARGLVEVGSEKPNTVHSSMDKQLASRKQKYEV